MVKGALFCFIAAVLGVYVYLPQSIGVQRHIKKLVYNNNGLGTYSFEFQTLDGTFRKEDGGIMGNTKDKQSLFVRGEYGYVDPEGKHHFVRYVADANGYQPLTDDDVRFNDRRIV